MLLQAPRKDRTRLQKGRGCWRRPCLVRELLESPHGRSRSGKVVDGRVTASVWHVEPATRYQCQCMDGGDHS